MAPFYVDVIGLMLMCAQLSKSQRCYMLPVCLMEHQYRLPAHCTAAGAPANKSDTPQHPAMDCPPDPSHACCWLWRPGSAGLQDMAIWRDKCGCRMQCTQQLCVADKALTTQGMAHWLLITNQCCPASTTQSGPKRARHTGTSGLAQTVQPRHSGSHWRATWGILMHCVSTV